MSSPLPTESRIFADRYRRELKRREAALAHYLSPGQTQWTEAVLDLFERIGKIGSPAKRAAELRKIAEYLNGNVASDDAAHFLLDATCKPRSAGLDLATMSAGFNPFLGVSEEGINIAHHVMYTRRNGEAFMHAEINLAFISKHAVGRLHERGVDLNNSRTTGVLACLGVLGLLTRNCRKHVAGGLCLRYRDTLIVGSLKHAMKPVAPNRETNGTLLDVRTALDANLVNNQAMLDQGDAAAHAVITWLKNREGEEELAELIPFMPRREDYTTLNSIPDRRSNQPK
jgi:hypothetical protein